MKPPTKADIERIKRAGPWIAWGRGNVTCNERFHKGEKAGIVATDAAIRLARVANWIAEGGLDEPKPKRGGRRGN